MKRKKKLLRLITRQKRLTRATHYKGPDTRRFLRLDICCFSVDLVRREHFLRSTIRHCVLSARTIIKYVLAKYVWKCGGGLLYCWHIRKTHIECKSPLTRMRYHMRYSSISINHIASIFRMWKIFSAIFVAFLDRSTSFFGINKLRHSRFAYIFGNNDFVIHIFHCIDMCLYYNILEYMT